MAWFRRRQPGAGGRPANREDLRHLEEFARSRRGVEGFIEPRTAVTETTLLLIAHDGEWTRRRIDNPQSARQLAHKLNMPVYDVALVGYPQRKRDYDARNKTD